MKQILLAFSLMLTTGISAQFFSHEHTQFSRQDTLRGSNTEGREWWDLKHYTLKVKVDIKNKSIKGENTIRYKVLKPKKTMQIELQEPMKITRIVQGKKDLKFTREGSVFFISLQDRQKSNSTKELTVHFEGSPVIAKRPPWDGGFTWNKDAKGRDFIANSNQGIGSSVWWPNKDFPADEPDEGIDILATVPSNLMDVSNGQLIETIENKDNTKTYHWRVVNPINNYGVNLNIATYVHFDEVYSGLKGDLKMDYYVLEGNLEKAKKHFKDATRMMDAFEHWFGPYPFYEDGFKLVEAPYLGMEHQSSVTYGNDYKMGYKGTDLSGSGWGLKFDFLIIHESGHEWFANNITNKDVADMWIHESFTAYSECIFLTYHYGVEACNQYVKGTRARIANDKPIVGPYGVNKEGSKDMYYKGSNMIHTMRQLINDDEKFRKMLNKVNKQFYHQTVTSKQIEDFFSKESKINLKPFFDQYLRTTKVPILEYYTRDGNFHYRWTNAVADFDMKLKVTIDGQEKWLDAKTKWNKLKLENPKSVIVLDYNFYIASSEILTK